MLPPPPLLASEEMKGNTPTVVVPAAPPPMSELAGGAPLRLPSSIVATLFPGVPPRLPPALVKPTKNVPRLRRFRLLIVIAADVFADGLMRNEFCPCPFTTSRVCAALFPAVALAVKVKFDRAIFTTAELLMRLGLFAAVLSRVKPPLRSKLITAFGVVMAPLAPLSVRI